MTGPVMFNDAPVRTEAMLSLFRTIQQRLLLLTLAAAALGAAIGFVIARLPGVWGALLAAALGLVFTIATVALLRFVAGRGPELLQVVLIGGWIVKMVLVVLVMLWLREQDFYHRGVFFGTLVVVVLGAVAIETWSVATAQIPHVEPRPAQTSDDDDLDVSSVTPDPAPSLVVEDGSADPQGTADDGGPRPIQGRSSGSQPGV